jgi:hypothetical protein
MMLFWNDSLSAYGEASYAATFSKPEGYNGVAGSSGGPLPPGRLRRGYQGNDCQSRR